MDRLVLNPDDVHRLMQTVIRNGCSLIGFMQRADVPFLATVLAHEPATGQWITWNYNFQDHGLALGHYFMPGDTTIGGPEAAARMNFQERAVRSGLFGN
jgi:hypothetical protein